MTFPKGWEPVHKDTQQNKKFVNTPKKDDPVDLSIGLLFYSNVGIILLLIFLPTSEEYKIGIFIVYFLLSIILISIIIYRHYQKNPIEQYFRNMSTIPNYKFYKTTIYIGPPILCIFFSLYYANSINSVLPIPIVPDMKLMIFTLSWNTLLLFLLVTYTQSGFASMMPSFISKDFHFYLAKKYLDKTSSENEIDKKIKLLNQGLHSYNIFLKREINLQISDVKRICSKIITDSKQDINKEIDKISESFDKTNKLKPIKTISSEVFEDKDSEHMLIKIGRGQKMDDYVGIIIPIISVIITIIGLIINQDS